jgi:hypothetical protein
MLSTVGGPSSYSVSERSHNRAVSCILGLAGKATVLAVELSRDFAEWRVQSQLKQWKLPQKRICEAAFRRSDCCEISLATRWATR